MIETRAVAVVEIEVRLDSDYGGKWTFAQVQEDARRALSNRLARLQEDNEDLTAARLVSLRTVTIEDKP